MIIHCNCLRWIVRSTFRSKTLVLYHYCYCHFLLSSAVLGDPWSKVLGAASKSSLQCRLLSVTCTHTAGGGRCGYVDSTAATPTRNLHRGFKCFAIGNSCCWYRGGAGQRRSTEWWHQRRPHQSPESEINETEKMLLKDHAESSFKLLDVCTNGKFCRFMCKWI